MITYVRIEKYFSCPEFKCRNFILNKTSNRGSFEGHQELRINLYWSFSWVDTRDSVEDSTSALLFYLNLTLLVLQNSVAWGNWNSNWMLASSTKTMLISKQNQIWNGCNNGIQTVQVRNQDFNPISLLFKISPFLIRFCYLPRTK